MKKISAFPLAFALAAFGCAYTTYAQPLVSIQTVTVGDAGNAADSRVMDDGTSGYGSVSYEFQIGKYEVTIAEYTTFLNSVAAVTSDAYTVNLWNPNMASDLRIAGISRSGEGTLSAPYSYSTIAPSGLAPTGANTAGNRPIAYISWFDAARFANWMHNGATNGASTETGAYSLNGTTNGIVIKNTDAKWWIPTEDEWYKAAYYKGDGTNSGYWHYPTQSDTIPGNDIGSATNQANRWDFDYAVTQAAFTEGQNYLTDAGAFAGSFGAYDTFDQGGNLLEWNDAVVDDASRGFRGGAFNQFGESTLRASWRGWADPLYSDEFGFNVGFRVATVPEPSTYALLLLSGAASLWALRRRKS
jgi:formylglycine-generating enzyme required for sulfatase activity